MLNTNNVHANHVLQFNNTVVYMTRPEVSVSSANENDSHLVVCHHGCVAKM